MSRPVVVLLRVFSACVFLMTSVYGIVTYSAFAFEMFVRPQLMPWLTSFVVWHHLWYWAAFTASGTTLLPYVTATGSKPPQRNALIGLSVGYLVCFGVVGVVLVLHPYLPTLWNDRRSLVVAIVSLVPIVWLSVIDHVAAPASSMQPPDQLPLATGQQRRLLAACVSTATYLWFAHFTRALWRSPSPAGALVWVATGVWSFAVSLTIFAIVYVLVALTIAIAAFTRSPRRWEQGLTTALVAAGICEFVRRGVLPAILFEGREAVVVSIALGASVAAMWSGLAGHRSTRQARTALDTLLAPATDRRLALTMSLITVPAAVFFLIARVERLDWNFVVQNTLVLVEWTVTFGLLLRLCDRINDRTWSAPLLVAPPIVAIALLSAVPTASAFVASYMKDARLEPAATLDWYASVDPSFRFAAGALVEQPAADIEFYRDLLGAAERSDARFATPRDIDFSSSTAAPVAAARPHVFFFVIDSLRRDYLSPYNPAVRFTPGLGEFAADSFVFRNVFTLYGGTWLAMPSIWAGGEVTRRWGSSGFDRMNAIEKLIVADGYRLVINDYTVAQHLRQSTPVTRLDPEVPSVDTDVCHLVDSLETHLDRTATDPRPVFAYLAPMNVHILNTRRGVSDGTAPEYSGFYAPYASRLKRLDSCFSEFVSNLKRRGLYDDSVIIVTSDHGDSLGERGNWGHQFFLFPEDVRLPLLVHVPRAVRDGVTTDLARLVLTTDIAPTLYALLGHTVRDLGPHFGTPMIVGRDETLVDRRRQPVLLRSSYGPTYGLVTRNGRSLYIADLMKWREFFFDLSSGPTGASRDLTDSVRRLNQRLIRQHLGAEADQ